MDRIEEIWDKGNDQIAQDDSFGSDAILKFISESSIGITSKMLKAMWLGTILAFTASLMLIYNLFSYMGNPSIVILIIVSLIASASIFTYLLFQLGIVKGMDRFSLNLREVLVYKIKYLNTRFNIALHCISLSIVLVTFNINLTIESGDGIFELRKILILTAFYLFAYVVILSLSMLTNKVYDKQLKNALLNLEENTLRSLDEEMKKHKRVGRIILIIVAICFVSGIAALLSGFWGNIF